MTDANSPWGDSAGDGREPRPGRRPTDQPGTAPDDPYGQYGPDAQHGSGQYGSGQYGGYQQGGDPYGSGGYDTGQYPPYQGGGQYGTGQYDTGQYPAGQYGADQYGTGQYGTGQYGGGQYDTGEQPPYDTGQYPPYPGAQYDTGQYPPYQGGGQYDTGEIRPSGQNQTGQYQTGQYQTGAYQADPASTGYQQPVSGDPYAPQQGAGPAAPAGYARPAVPRQQPRTPPRKAVANPYEELAELATPEPDEEPAGPAAPAAAPPPGGYRTEQFAFVDDEPEDEEVIDWLKFAETRSERRDERRRKIRSRLLGLVVVLVLVLAGGVGYLGWKGKLPFGGSKSPAAGSGPQKRRVIAVHLMELGGKKSSTALLVNNETTKKATTLLLPNSLAVSTDEAGSTTLGKSVEDQGATPTRESLSTLLGTDVSGTWRLDTPFLQVLVEEVGGIDLDTDATVQGTGKNKGKTLVKKGAGQQLNGAAAVAYATYRAPGESPDKQLARFGAVLRAVLEKMPSDAKSATEIVDGMGAVPDPSLPDDRLGATLAPLAEDAKTGAYTTRTLPVAGDGTLDESITKGLVKSVLGGAVKNTDPDGTPRVSVRNASGRSSATGDAQVALVNAGYTFASGGSAHTAQQTSEVEYTSSANADTAGEVAKTLGLPKSAVQKAKAGQGAQNADITVVLGTDYQG